jgi:hypothetical protein
MSHALSHSPKAAQTQMDPWWDIRFREGGGTKPSITNQDRKKASQAILKKQRNMSLSAVQLNQQHQFLLPFPLPPLPHNHIMRARPSVGS